MSVVRFFDQNVGASGSIGSVVPSVYTRPARSTCFSTCFLFPIARAPRVLEHMLFASLAS